MATYTYSGQNINLNQMAVQDNWVDGDYVYIDVDSSAYIESTIDARIFYYIKDNAILDINPANTTDFVYVNCSANSTFTLYTGSRYNLNGNLVSLGNLDGNTTPSLDISALDIRFIPPAVYVVSDNRWYFNINWKYDWYSYISAMLPDNEIPAFSYDATTKVISFPYMKPFSLTSEIKFPQIVLHYNNFSGGLQIPTYDKTCNAKVYGTYFYDSSSWRLSPLLIDVKDSVIPLYCQELEGIVDSCAIYYTTSSSWGITRAKNLTINNCDILSYFYPKFVENLVFQNSRLYTSTNNVIMYKNSSEDVDITIDNCQIYGTFGYIRYGKYKILNSTIDNGSLVSSSRSILNATEGYSFIMQNCTINNVYSSYSYIIDINYFNELVLNNITINIKNTSFGFRIQNSTADIRNITINRNYSETSSRTYSIVKSNINMYKFSDDWGYFNWGYTYGEWKFRDMKIYYSLNYYPYSTFLFEDTSNNKLYFYIGFYNYSKYIIEDSGFTKTANINKMNTNDYFIAKITANDDVQAVDTIDSVSVTYGSSYTIYFSNDGTNWTTTLPFTPSRTADGKIEFYIKVVSNADAQNLYYMTMNFTPKTSNYDLSYYPNTFTLSGIEIGSEVRIYDMTNSSNPVEIFGIENTTTTDVVFKHNYTNLPVKIVVFALGYEPVYINYILNRNQTIPIVQNKDRWYNNP